MKKAKKKSELAEDVIKAGSVLIHALTFTGHCSVKGVAADANTAQ